MQSSERHQLDMSDKHRVIPGRYNPLEEVANIDKIEKIIVQKLNTSITRLTITKI